MKKSKRLLCAGLSLFITASALAGCGEKKSAATTDIASGADFKYPIKTSEKLQWWYTDYTAGKVKREEAPLYNEIEKRTGVEVEYIPVTPSVAQEQFNLLLASGKLPDIITYNWAGFPGGIQSVVDSGHILNLNDLIKDYMPNLKAYIAEDKEREKLVKNDEGNICYVPAYRGDKELLTYTGPIIRKDWLDELGLEVPQTLDEWYTVLKAFKEKKGAASPFVCASTYLSMFISGAYPISFGGYSDDCYLDDNGNVVYGPIQPATKDALKVLNKWYKEGLIDQNIVSVDDNTINAKMTNGQAGASFALAGGGLGKWMTNSKPSNPGYNLTGAKYPVVNKGERPYLGQKDNEIMNVGQAIAKSSKNPALAARYLDYFFSKEGIELFNYGAQGVACDEVNGAIKLKSDIIKSGETEKYANPFGGVGVQKWDAYSQTLVYDNQREAILNWEDTDAQKHILPALSFTKEENSRVSKKISDIKTYESEKFFSFMLGVEDIDAGFDEYVAQIKAMGIDEVIQCKQAALERYNKR